MALEVQGTIKPCDDLATAQLPACPRQSSVVEMVVHDHLIVVLLRSGLCPVYCMKGRYTAHKDSTHFITPVWMLDMH
jgi:hypothetical protein